MRDHVHGRLDLAFEERGSLNLKNITRPVEAFVLKPDAATTTKSIERSLLGGIGEALPLPDKPSIAVLAFTNMSGDPEQEYFSDGIAEDIITELSRSRSLFVIARNSSFTYRGRAVDIKQVARELGVRYVLEGSVRREAIRVRINAQLIDAETGNHIWAERYDREIEHMFAVQDEIAEAVAVAIRPAVGDAEQRRVLRKPPGSLSAWEAYQRGLWHEAKHNAAYNALAREFFQQAIHLDKTFAHAHAELAYTYLVDSIYELRSREEASAMAMRQAEISPFASIQRMPRRIPRGVAHWSMSGIPLVQRSATIKHCQLIRPMRGHDATRRATSSSVDIRLRRARCSWLISASVHAT